MLLGSKGLGGGGGGGDKQSVYLVVNILFVFVHPSWAVLHYIRFSYKPARLHSTVLKNQKNVFIYK